MGSDSNAGVTLFTHKFSPYALRVHLALLEKGIPFKPVFVDLANKPKELLEANPIHKKVPAMIHNGKSVVESLVILEYSEDVRPEHVPLMPKDAHEKSQIRFWSDYIYKGFTTLRESFISEPGTPEKEAAKEGSVKFFITVEKAMSSYSAEGPFFTGDKFGLLDVVLSPIMSLLLLLETMGGVVIPGPDEIPRFHKWLEAMKARPSVSSTIPSAEEMSKYITNVFQRRAAAVAAAEAAGARR